MKMPAFEYACPTTLSEAVSLLASGNGEAKPLAGGQSLVPMLAFRLAQPALLVDLRKLADLRDIKISTEGVRLSTFTVSGPSRRTSRCRRALAKRPRGPRAASQSNRAMNNSTTAIRPSSDPTVQRPMRAGVRQRAGRKVSQRAMISWRREFLTARRYTP